MRRESRDAHLTLEEDAKSDHTPATAIDPEVSYLKFSVPSFISSPYICPI